MLSCRWTGGIDSFAVNDRTPAVIFIQTLITAIRAVAHTYGMQFKRIVGSDMNAPMLHCVLYRR
jgi:hypothetical protein